MSLLMVRLKGTAILLVRGALPTAMLIIVLLIWLTAMVIRLITLLIVMTTLLIMLSIMMIGTTVLLMRRSTWLELMTVLLIRTMWANRLMGTAALVVLILLIVIGLRVPLRVIAIVRWRSAVVPGVVTARRSKW